MPLSAESLKNLDQVKKTGKPCKFVLISKGANVVSVVAYRKGSDDTRIREAKDAGNGDVSCGVVDGQGTALSFKLLRASGYEAAPVKNTALRDFLNEGTELKAKPTIDIVDTLPKVEMEGEGQPQRPQNQPQAQFRYRTSDEWKAIVARIQSTTDKVAQVELLMQAARDCRAETDQVNRELEGNPNSNTAQAQRTAIGKVADILKRLNPQLPPAPQPPSQPPNRPPPLPPLPPTPLPPLPLTPPQQQMQARQMVKDIASAGVKAIEAATMAIYNKSERDRILQECETDLDSDFGKVLAKFELGREDTYDQVISRYIQAKQLAAKYIKEHGEPKIGKLPARVLRRKEYCAKIIADIDKQLNNVGEQNLAAVNMARAYQAQVAQGVSVPYEAAMVLENLLKRRLLSDDTKREIQAAIDAVNQQERQTAYSTLQNTPGASDREKAEILNRHGVFGRTAGGTSDVRLLKNADGSIAYAYKSVDGESAGGLEFLNLAPGASAMREDISSTICREIQSLTQLDLGFPESRVVKLDGRTGALIQGLKGEMADPEEQSSLFDIEKEQGLEVAEQKRAKIRKNCLEIPDQVSPESLQDVVLSSVMTGQWDCKWGNMIVDGNRARPIDGGTSIPTKDVVRRFRDEKGGSPSLTALTMYPNFQEHPNWGQTMPAAQQPMNPQKVAAILSLDAGALMANAKARRDQLLQENPEFNMAMMEDSCFEVVKASIEGAQGILRANPTITLENFAKEYERWFTTYAVGV